MENEDNLRCSQHSSSTREHFCARAQNFGGEGRARNRSSPDWVTKGNFSSLMKVSAMLGRLCSCFSFPGDKLFLAIERSYTEGLMAPWGINGNHTHRHINIYRLLRLRPAAYVARVAGPIRTPLSDSLRSFRCSGYVRAHRGKSWKTKKKKLFHCEKICSRPRVNTGVHFFASRFAFSSLFSLVNIGHKEPSARSRKP